MSDEKAELAGTMPTNDPPPPYSPAYSVPSNPTAAPGEYPPGAYTQMGPQGQTYPQNPAYGGQTYPGQPYPPAGPYQPSPQGQWPPPVTYNPGAAGTPGPPPVTYYPGSAGTPGPPPVTYYPGSAGTPGPPSVTYHPGAAEIQGTDMASVVVIQPGGVIQHPKTFIHQAVVDSRDYDQRNRCRHIVIFIVCVVLTLIVVFFFVVF